MSDIVTLRKLTVLKAKFIVWTEWGDDKNQRYLTDYFSIYDMICASMILFPIAFFSALFFHLLTVAFV